MSRFGIWELTILWLVGLTCLALLAAAIGIPVWLSLRRKGKGPDQPEK